jgi:hypothetical protein
MSTDHRRYVLASFRPGVYHLTIRKIIFQKDVLESMHKKITQMNKQHVLQLRHILLTSKNYVLSKDHEFLPDCEG